MIAGSSSYDLGQDHLRMKDPRDALRQSETVNEILRRFFNKSTKKRREIQLLADEVGMGKTFVALAAAFSVLEHMRGGVREPDIAGCYQKVLVITPGNHSLYSKWRREVGEFVRRCIREPLQPEVGTWFRVPPDREIKRLDELVVELRRPGASPRVLVAGMGIFDGGKFKDFDLKMQFLLGVLFRHWGTRFRSGDRKRLLRGGRDLGTWPRQAHHLTRLSEEEREGFPFSEEELLQAVRALDRPAADEEDGNPVADLLASCKEIAAPYQRDREPAFQKLTRLLARLYRDILGRLLQQAIPLVIVDEAHNWKNEANGYKSFIRTVAPRTRRALLLTATPFQLRPEEMLNILRVSDHLEPCPTQRESEERRQALNDHREKIIRPVLAESETASRIFAKAWSRLPRDLAPEHLQGVWESQSLAAGRRSLDALAREEGVLPYDALDREARAATAGLDPREREFFREALHLYARNADLSAELGPLVIRHRRHTHHRAIRVGSEYRHDSAGPPARPDRHLLHGAPGIDVRGNAELPHYLLMRCVSVMKGGKGRTSLGNSLTGCYSTLLGSSEGKAIEKALRDSPTGRAYMGLLRGLVNENMDPGHPKVQALVESVLDAWRRGEKSLVFCFRVNTAERLRTILDERIRGDLEERSRRCLGGKEALAALRARITGRDRDLVGLGLDRVLWSLHLGSSLPTFPREALRLQDRDFDEMASIAIRFQEKLEGERPDRVFLHRVTEAAMARRILGDGAADPSVRPLLEAMSDLSWVDHPYGLSDEDGPEEVEGEGASADGKGVHAPFPRDFRVRFKLNPAPLARRLRERALRPRERDQASLFDAYHDGPNLWLGPHPAEAGAGPGGGGAVKAIHRHLSELTFRPFEKLDGASRRRALQALRRAVLQTSVLVRLLPESAEREESTWGDLLVERFHAPLPGQAESMADRFAAFLEDLVAASGEFDDATSARHALFEATRLKDRSFVALVTGATNRETRERMFSGFNTPLLPEVLVCTSVGQEGIDLHRHCRHVVHYDLAWNPAVIEQRTGRTDRIGSKTFRERERTATPEAGPFLEIGVPFLAGTYDERMYEELRLRAQTFEILTGGDLAADNPESVEGEDESEGQSVEASLAPLPPEMIGKLRVNLQVWEEPVGLEASRPAAS